MSGSKLGTGLMVVAGVVIAATVVTAIVVMGSPSVQRERRMDQRRVQDLNRIQQAVETHYRQQSALPTGLAVLAARPGSSLSIHDPADGRAYVYRTDSTTAYTLCARFQTDSSEQAGGGWVGIYARDTDWLHGRGETCFPRRVEPMKR